MKILLDECVPKKLKPYLNDFEVFSVSEMGWSGVKNGKLLSLCSDHGFNIFLTIDKNIMYQQNLEKCQITIVAFNSSTSKLEELILFIQYLRQCPMACAFHMAQRSCVGRGNRGLSLRRFCNDTY